MWTYYTCLLQEVVRSKYRCTIVESSSVQEIIPNAKRKLIDRDEAENFCMLVCRSGKTYECRKTVLCAGPWTNHIMEKLSWVYSCIIDQPQLLFFVAEWFILERIHCLFYSGGDYLWSLYESMCVILRQTKIIFHIILFSRQMTSLWIFGDSQNMSIPVWSR